LKSPAAEEACQKSCSRGSMSVSYWSSGYKSITSDRTGSEWR